jgi:murein DD-endopeptidase
MKMKATIKSTHCLRGFLLLFLLQAEPVVSQTYQTSVEMRLAGAPEAVNISRKPTLYYELQITNFASDSIVLKKLSIMNPVDSSLVVALAGTELNQRYQRIGVTPEESTDLLPPGASGIIYLEIAFQTGQAPLQLVHRLEGERLHGQSKESLSVLGALSHLSQAPPVVLGPPLREGSWAAVYEPSWQRGHRRVIYTIDGLARIPGRFAIDFIKLDQQGRYARADENGVKNWYGYGTDVLAVCDGVIASIRNDFPESATLSQHPAYSPDQASGNYVALAIGNNRFVFYEHLKPGSIRVKAGQRVRKGEVIASVGFTGQTTGPHLHFHLADGNSPLGAEGVPFAFERFVILGSYPDFEQFGKVPWTPAAAVPQSILTSERPAPNSVINFYP